MVRVIAPLALIAAVTCSAAGSRISMRMIDQGAYGAAAANSGHVPPEVDIATDEDRYRLLWGKVVGGSVSPAVNFQKESIVFLSAGQRMTGGFSIGKPEVSMKGTSAVIRAPILTPSARRGRRPIVTMALSAPYAVIAVDRPKLQMVRWVGDDGSTIAEAKKKTR
jgi:hypothetical protein